MTSVPPEELAKDAVRLMRSASIRTAVIWCVSAVVLPCAGWAYAKLETKTQMDALERQVASLARQQGELVTKIDGLTAAPTEVAPGGGPIFRLSVEARYAQRAAVRATAVALSYEREKRRKLDAAELMLTAFDNRVKDGKAPSTAGEEAVSAVALP